MGAGEAPDFTPGYPSRGERIGPWWAAAWALLADRQPRTWMELARAIPDPPVAPMTARNVVQRAVAAGLLTREIRRTATGQQLPTLYRRPS